MENSWTYAKCDGKVWIEDEHGKAVAIIAENIDKVANGILISATPDLLEACQLTFDWLRAVDFNWDSQPPEYVMNALEQAIAKATQQP